MVPTSGPPVTRRSLGARGFVEVRFLLSLRFSREALRREVALSRPLPRGVTTVPKMSRRSMLTAASTRSQSSTRNPMRKTVNARSVVTSLNSALVWVRPEEDLGASDDDLVAVKQGRCVDAVALNEGAVGGAQISRDHAGGSDAQFEVAA